ncbi:TadE family type IV pilus minor pilin [Streptomyces tardus]|uniref:TadE family type IV pilus minor pilin n=1 Tax=Streptomyces tardus TaxID=2780544 RepID=UPI0027E56E9C|nr:TadE family type IV pilus minor pilin [Streptomyces tardus]
MRSVRRCECVVAGVKADVRRGRARCLCRWRDSGQATAETAVVVPSLVLLTAMLLWGLLAGAAHIQCVDAARAGARAAARAEPWPGVTAAARQVAPAGAEVEARRVGDLVRVRVRARSAGPGPLSVELSAEAVAQAEDRPPPGGPPPGQPLRRSTRQTAGQGRRFALSPARGRPGTVRAREPRVVTVAAVTAGGDSAECADDAERADAYASERWARAARGERRARGSSGSRP